MKKYSAILSAIVLGLTVFSSMTAVAAGAGDALMPTEITPADAAKKYPLPAGKSYPSAISTTTSSVGGFFQSPYSSRVYDCRKLKHGALIVDDGAKKVFTRP